MHPGHMMVLHRLLCVYWRPSNYHPTWVAGSGWIAMCDVIKKKLTRYRSMVIMGEAFIDLTLSEV